ncbi:MAG: hypothetical protein WC683_08205 [bacterium]
MASTPTHAALVAAWRMLLRGGDEHGTQGTIGSSVSTSCPPVTPVSVAQPLTMHCATRCQGQPASTWSEPEPTPENASAARAR